MQSTKLPTILIVPGLRDHVEEHWQTLLAAKLPNVRSVAPLEDRKLSRDARVEALERELAAIEGPVVIVAHSAGAMTVAHWAQRPTRDIRGALMATPSDMETPMPDGYPALDVLQQNGWTPIPMRKLPFPSIVAASSNDPLTTFERAREFAEAWGSELVELGPVGHLNPASGYGEWPRAMAFIEALS